MKKKRCTCTLHRLDNELIQPLGITLEDAADTFQCKRRRNVEEKLHLYQSEFSVIWVIVKYI